MDREKSKFWNFGNRFRRTWRTIFEISTMEGSIWRGASFTEDMVPRSRLTRDWLSIVPIELLRLKLAEFNHEVDDDFLDETVIALHLEISSCKNVCLREFSRSIFFFDILAISCRKYSLCTLKISCFFLSKIFRNSFLFWKFLTIESRNRILYSLIKLFDKLVNFFSSSLIFRSCFVCLSSSILCCSLFSSSKRACFSSFPSASFSDCLRRPLSPKVLLKCLL